MEQETQNYLSVALKRLEKAYSEILKTKGYGEQSEKIKLLQEMVKEQVVNENTRTAAR